MNYTSHCGHCKPSCNRTRSDHLIHLYPIRSFIWSRYTCIVCGICRILLYNFTLSTGKSIGPNLLDSNDCTIDNIAHFTYKHKILNCHFRNNSYETRVMQSPLSEFYASRKVMEVHLDYDLRDAYNEALRLQDWAYLNQVDLLFNICEITRN